ncbi:cyclic AMP-dependent transcription factor ATF-5 [Camelus ferus]|nr:cyclic AMP-dependent transcription factor ATF-5 [Camelus ferus]
MSLLATLGLDLDRTLVPASGLGWLIDYGSHPPPQAPALLGPYEVLGGALEGGLPGGGAPLVDDGFPDWMTELVDFTALPPLEPPCPQAPALDTLDLLAIYCCREAGPGDSGLATRPPSQQPLCPPPPSRPAPYPNPATAHGDHEQKERDQTTSAALRYLPRKRPEGEALEGGCQGLETRNRELRETAE